MGGRAGWRVRRAKKKRLEGLPLQPFLPIPPRARRYLLKVPKKAERLFGSLHFVPSIEPLKLF